MREICAWCGSTMQIRCSHCNAPLAAANVLGGSFGFYGDAMICLNGETPIVFSRHSLEKIEKTYGLCETCAALPKDEREAMIKIRRAADRSIPDDNAIARTMQEIESTNKHERETRAHRRPQEKRGPTGVTRSATPHAESERKK
jgi:hypothetical protein